MERVRKKERRFSGRVLGYSISLLAFVLGACTPVHDTVLRDVERNYTATGFLDPNTYQVLCTLSETSPREKVCIEKLQDSLVLYKENYEKEASKVRMHKDYLPYFSPEPVTERERGAWRRAIADLCEGYSRIVFEKLNGDSFDGVYRVRRKDLIYLVQDIEP